jgi:uncharacterized repeat protein (TIGR03803 family)
MPSHKSSLSTMIAGACVAALATLPTTLPAAPRFQVLHAFTGGYDGAALWGSLLLDAQGNVYGTTYTAGPGGGGTVFELSPQGGGAWAYSLVFDFGGNPPAPGGSTAGLMRDPAGNLYGTTGFGGESGYGTAFELSPQPGGWKETTLYSFPPPGPAGCCPYGGVVMDPAGHLYGTAGVAFELSPGPSGWQATILHTFLPLLSQGRVRALRHADPRQCR